MLIPERNRPFPQYLKILTTAGFVFVTIFALGFFAVYLKQKAKGGHAQLKNRYEIYRLPERFSREDVAKLISQLRLDEEFYFYFYALKDLQIQKAADETYALFQANPDAASLLQQMYSMKEQIESQAVLFYHLDYNDEFIRNPSDFPELQKILWDFLYQEFKLTVLGVYYKGTYDPAFVFQWSPMVHQAAEKLRELISRLQ